MLSIIEAEVEASASLGRGLPWHHSVNISSTMTITKNGNSYQAMRLIKYRKYRTGLGVTYFYIVGWDFLFGLESLLVRIGQIKAVT